MGKKMKYVLIRRTKIGQTTQRFATKPRAEAEALKWIKYREAIEGGVLSMTSTAQVLPIGEYNRQQKALQHRGKRKQPLTFAQKLRKSVEKHNRRQDESMALFRREQKRQGLRPDQPISLMEMVKGMKEKKKK